MQAPRDLRAPRRRPHAPHGPGPAQRDDFARRVDEAAKRVTAFISATFTTDVVTFGAWVLLNRTAVSRSPSGWPSASATAHPLSPRRSASARPMPLHAPVTTAKYPA
ncbi:MAG TPA: hypothetical protein VGP82_05720 [Ktedonobacterales bacterium]|nr:hypothetical protein [Ktedonobacterales bacterium]